MQKCLLMIFALCLILTGCTKPTPTEGGSGETDSTASTSQTTTTSGSTTSTSTASPVTFSIYIPKENYDGLDAYTVTIDTLSPDLVLQALAERGGISPDARVLSAVMDGTMLRLDMNEAFLLQLYSMGSIGEGMLVGSLVNTFLSAYTCETVFLTAEGEIIHSGHVDYDFPLGPFFPDET